MLKGYVKKINYVRFYTYSYQRCRENQTDINFDGRIDAQTDGYTDGWKFGTISHPAISRCNKNIVKFKIE